MTNPVETLARALELHMTRVMALDKARALLAQITPALVAEAVARERESIAAQVEGESLNPNLRRIAAAIRARKP